MRYKLHYMRPMSFNEVFEGKIPRTWCGLNHGKYCNKRYFVTGVLGDVTCNQCKKFMEKAHKKYMMQPFIIHGC